MLESRYDTDVLVETPESIDLHSQVAGPIPRALAYVIDFFIRAGILTALGSIFALTGEGGMGLFLVISFLMEWFYPVIFEVYRKGQTPGKKSMQIAVVNDDLTPVTWSASLTRNLLRAADFLPFGYIFGLTSSTLNPQFKRLGDLAAGTLVIYQYHEKMGLTLPECQSHPSPIPLSLEDQTAIIGYTQRHSRLSKDRQQELANVLVDTLNIKPDKAITYIHGIGCWLLGDKR